MGRVLRFDLPTLKDKEAAIDFIMEFQKHNSKIFGTGGLNKQYDKYEEWLKYLNDCSSYETIEKGKEPSVTYFVRRSVDNKIIGMTNIRFHLNEYLLKDGGHIGYSVRPTERLKGYAKEILRMGLEELKIKNISPILITCNKDNIGSRKTIIANGGIKENEVISKDNDIVERYWIYL